VSLRNVHRALHRLLGGKIAMKILEPAIEVGADRRGLLEQVDGSGELGSGGVHFALELPE
jgi:hypothetical protein